VIWPNLVVDIRPSVARILHFGHNKLFSLKRYMHPQKAKAHRDIVSCLIT